LYRRPGGFRTEPGKIPAGGGLLERILTDLHLARPRKNIDPEQVRKLAGWGLTQNDIANFVGWSQSLVSLRFSSCWTKRLRRGMGGAVWLG
jgi:hypothetical protein